MYDVEAYVTTTYIPPLTVNIPMYSTRQFILVDLWVVNSQTMGKLRSEERVDTMRKSNQSLLFVAIWINNYSYNLTPHDTEEHRL